MQAGALWHQSATASAWQEAPLPQLQANEVLIQSQYSLISLGTERLVASGQVPAALYAPMRVPYMGGDFSFPIKYGYSLVGTVATADHPWAGRTVHLLHPHQSHAHAAVAALSLVPEEVPPRRAALASNLETALNAIWDSEVSLGDSVIVVGFGLIGALTAQLLRDIPGVELWVVEKNAARRQLAERLGFSALAPEEELPVVDLAFHCSGSATGLQLAIDAVGPEAKIMEMSWYGARSVEIQLGGSFHYQRKQIISTQVSQLPAQRRATRWDYDRRKKVVFDFLKNNTFDAYITQELIPAQLPAFFDQLRQNVPQGLGVVIKY